MRLGIIAFMMALGMRAVPCRACTSVLVAGWATVDGRPLLLKNRDTDNQHNHAQYLHGERYRSIAIVGDNSADGGEVWSGHNEAGFAIVNTAAYNINKKQAEENEGRIMRRALDICSSLRDFETLVDTLPRPLGASANFGVIDAHGGCAYYEVGDSAYTKYDVNDSLTAPDGYLVRTNFCVSGDRSRDEGVERFFAAEEYMRRAVSVAPLDAVTLITRLTRYLKHGLTHIDLNVLQPGAGSERTLFPFRDFIPRYITASAQLFEGVRQGENPLLTIAWTMVGSPLATVAIPLVITPAESLPAVVSGGYRSPSWLCSAGLRLKRRLFPFDRSNGSDYIDLSRLLNKAGTGVLQQVTAIERPVVARGRALIDMLRDGMRDDGHVAAYYAWVDDFITKEYKERFGL